MKNINFKYLIFGALLVTLFSCAKKLDLFPQNDLTPDKVYKDYNGYMQVLAKLYGGMAIGGNQGPSGQPDISGGLDEGSQIAFIRPFFNCQELPTDEAVCYWNDQTIKNYHYFKYDANDPFIKGMYARLMWNVTLANEFIKQATDATLTSKGISGSNLTDLQNARNEARFLRAFNYWAMMDLFGKSSFITENDVTGTLPKEISRTNLFNYISGELKAIEAILPAAKSATYGRVDKAATWALMARMYLNANVYLGTSSTTYYDTAITYAQKVINAGYALHSSYPALFMADNDKCTDEIIWAIQCDGLNQQSYGNTTFIVNASCNDDKPYYYQGGTGSGWSGYVATKNIWTNSFASDVADGRGLFTTYSTLAPSAGTKLYNTSVAQIEIGPDLMSVNETWFKDVANASGLHVAKFRNVRADGAPVTDIVNHTFSDIDFPIFRLAEMYLIYTEAVLRGGTGGTSAQALAYMKLLRERAYGNATADPVLGDLTLDWVLKERGRELYWEGFRRTDLVRYGLLTTNTYLWPWKGGVKSGTSVDSKYNLFPIPASVINSNPNLTQNAGY